MSPKNRTSITNTRVSFIRFITQEKNNRRLLIIAGISVLLEFILFKSFYPFADFFSDSYSYIYGASANLDINIWPIGYSKFLRAAHELSHSDLFVVAIQYFLLEVSALYFFFTITYLYNPTNTTKNILFIFLFFNPLFLYLSNYINSDPLFAALSMLWLTELLWIIHHPRFYHIFTQGILLFLAFTVRNNAYYYPLIAALAFLLSRQQWRVKMTGILFPLILIIPFIIHTRNEASKLTGTPQFSLFTGWQLANNALYMYGHLKVNSASLPEGTKDLDKYSKAFYKGVPPDFSGILGDYVANFFIRQPESPLKQYFNNNYTPQSEYEIVVDWGKASVIYGAYGEWLIRHYPIQFAKYFMLLNTKNFFFPPLEKLEVYNLGQDYVSPIAQDWFDYKISTVKCVSNELQGSVLFLFPYAFFFFNILFIASLVWVSLKKKQILLSRELSSTIILISSLLLINFIFCVFATIIVLRYQFFPMIATLTLSLLLIEALEKYKIVGKELKSSTLTTTKLEMAEVKI